MTTTETARILEVSPAIAQQWIADYQYEAQRSPDRKTVEYYASEMRLGRFKQSTQIEIASLDGSKYLVDGQHRLLAVMECGLSQRFVVLEVPVKTREDLDYRYAQTDRGRMRTVTDQYRALSLPQEFGLTETQVNALGSAVLFIRGNFERSTNKGVSLEDKLALMREYGVYAGYFYEVTAGAVREISPTLVRQSTLSVALITYRYSAKRYGVAKIDEFWQGVATDNGLQVGDARKVAHRHLLRTGMVGGAVSSRYVERVPASESAIHLANCFSAFVEGRPLNYTRVYKDSAIRIAGSPFAGKLRTKAA